MRGLAALTAAFALTAVFTGTAHADGGFRDGFEPPDRWTGVNTQDGMYSSWSSTTHVEGRANGYLTSRNGGLASTYLNIDVASWGGRGYCGARVLVNPVVWDNYVAIQAIDAETGRVVASEAIRARGNYYQPLETYLFDLNNVRTVRIRILFSQRDRSPNWDYMMLDDFLLGCSANPPSRWP